MLKPIRVLHFEDNPADVRLFKEYLKEASDDYIVQSAGSLSAGLKLLETGSYDIVLLDLGLPDGTGIECLRRIRPFVPDIPILVLSGERDEHLARKTVHEGAQDYLIKDDISARALVRSIDYAIERKQTERRILHLNSILRSIQAINRLIVREKHEQKLLQGACGILHTEGKFSIAWIGLLDRSSNQVVPEAAAGLDIGIIRRHTVTTDDQPTGKGPSGTVVNLKETRVFTDLSDKRFDPWRDSIREIGITSGIASPLIIDDTVFGVLNVYSRNPNPFSNEEAALIEEVAGDLSFAVSSIRAKREKERMARSLREGEERFRNLIDNLNDIVFNVDRKGYITYISPIITQITDRTPEEIIGRRFEEFLDEHQSEIIGEHFKDILTGKKTLFEIKMKNKDGSDRDFRISSRLQSVGGRITGVCGIMSDITEKRRAEAELIRTNEALRESELRYRLLAENANDMIFTTDMNLNLTYFSPSITRLRGFTPQEAMAQTPAQALTPASLQIVKDVLEKEMGIETNGGKKFRRTRTLQLEMIRKDGSTIWTETTFSTLRNRDMTPVGFLGITRDISERRRNEEALKESEERFRTLFESSKDAILVVTVSGEIVAINSAGLDLFGYAEHKMDSINTAAFYPDPEERARFKEKIERDGYLKDYEIVYRKKDGTLLDCLETATAIRDERGAIVGYQGTIRDVSEHRKMEKRLIQAEKLSSLGGMISGVAHELNNPLTSIIGNAQLLMRKEIPPDFRNKLEVIQRESIRCTKIVGGLLSFAREHRPERRMIDINMVVTESLRLREYDLKVNNIRIDADLAKDIPQTAADPHQLQQVFVNLINNSHDALAEKRGGTISIKSFSKDSSIHVVFSDDGPGIASDDLNRVFDPFFTTRDVGKGTGLGLSIAYGIINEHGGTIDAESRRGKGSTFTVRIPIVEQYEPPITNSGVISPVAAPKKRRILVVEDEEPLQKILIEALTEEGYGVKGVSNGQEAIELLKIVRFDCIISDFKMPGIGGKQLYEFIRKHTPDLSDRVLFITGDVLGKDTQRFLRDTGNLYIEKPFELSQLFSLVQKLFSGLK